MATMQLVIGSKTYSSWSWRAWLPLRRLGVPFEEVLVPLGQEDTRERILAHSPTGRVPVLHDGDIRVWDSLAIGEYLAEMFPQAGLWPADAAARAEARSLCAEMHSGFQVLRSSMPMNCRARRPAPEPSDGLEADIARIVAIWEGCRGRFGGSGPFLFGSFTLADAFFTPVVSRFVTYGVQPEGRAAAYMDTIWTLPEVEEWVEAARDEPWRHPTYDQ